MSPTDAQWKLSQSGMPSHQDLRHFATFKLENALYGIEILYIREINQQFDVTEVQHTPPFVYGLVNLRGQIVTVLDLKKRFGGESQTIRPTSHTMVLKTDGELAGIRDRENRPDLRSTQDTIGLLVEEIGDVVTVHPDDIQPSPPNTHQADTSFTAGVVRLEQQVMSVIHVQNILGL